MTFDIRWYKEGHVLICDFKDPMSDEQAGDFNDAMLEYFEASPRVLVHGIFDFSQTSSIFSIKVISQFTFPKHPRMGWNIFVALPNKRVTFVISIVTQIFKVRVHHVDTMQEAYKFLEWVDQTVLEG